MNYYIGADLGTSALKLFLVKGEDKNYPIMKRMFKEIK